MNTEEEKNEWIVNFFGCKKDIRVIFGAVIILTFIYWAIMCFIFCCGHEPDNTTLWGSSANFGNMFGYLSCVFSGLASVAMVATFIKQGEQLKIQEKNLEFMKKGIDKQAESIDFQKESLLQTDRSNEERKFTSMIDVFHESIMNMSVMEKKGTDAADQLFQLAIQAIKSIEINEVEISNKDVEKFTKAVHSSFYHLSFKALYILKSLNDSAILPYSVKESLTLYFISSMSTSTKKLLDIMFLLNDSLKQIPAFDSLFSQEKTYNMIKGHAKVKEETIMSFFNIIKEAWSVQR